MKNRSRFSRCTGPAGLVVAVCLSPTLARAAQPEGEEATDETPAYEASADDSSLSTADGGDVDSSSELNSEGEVGGDYSATGPSTTITSTTTETTTTHERRGFFQRVKPRPQVVELGIYGGVYFPSLAHALFAQGATFKRFAPVMGSLGVRLGYYPMSWMGVEVEGGGFPGTLNEDVGGDYIRFYHLRGSVLFQLPYRFTPFILGGAGSLFVNSSRAQLGTEADPAAHAGAGLKLYVLDWMALRAEWRGTFAAHRDMPETREPASHHEILLGLSFVIGSKKEEKAAAAPVPMGDRDQDGFLDGNDACPDEAGVSPDGCPIPDRDGDGFPNESDACPDVAGVTPDGCPVEDRDRDGINDVDDKCPDEPGVEPDGCPIGDRDSDQILDPDDQCPDKPETRNGFEDTDGCPDEVPKEVQEFTGVIRGIYFDVNKSSVQLRSHRVLNEAVAVLKRHPSINIEIVGHTDSSGKAEYNKELSESRANAVRDYLVQKGIDSERITARGAGEESPVASNDTPTGRAENRRTEFNIIKDAN